MKSLKRLAALPASALMLLMMAAGCGQKSKGPEPITGLKSYTDTVTQFKLQYPDNWQIVQKSAGRSFFAYPSKEAQESFKRIYASPAEINNSAAQIAVILQPLRGRVLDSVVFDNMADMVSDTIYKEKKSITIDGQPGYMLRYSYPLADGLYEGEKYISIKDTSFVTVVEFSAFSSSFAQYKPKFDEILRSVVLASNPVEKKQSTDTLVQNSEPAPPSATLRTVNGTGFSISVPDNFSGKRTQNQGTLYSSSYQGDRLDCTIQVDVFDASKQNKLAKIVEDNKSKYRATSAEKTTLGGVDAYFMNYSFVKDVQSRVYFAIKGDKMYRVTMNWFTPKKDVYLPAFEKCVATFKIN
jgi:hypothetical protein